MVIIWVNTGWHCCCSGTLRFVALCFPQARLWGEVEVVLCWTTGSGYRFKSKYFIYLCLFQNSNYNHNWDVQNSTWRNSLNKDVSPGVISSEGTSRFPETLSSWSQNVFLDFVRIKVICCEESGATSAWTLFISYKLTVLLTLLRHQRQTNQIFQSGCDTPCSPVFMFRTPDTAGHTVNKRHYCHCG